MKHVPGIQHSASNSSASFKRSKHYHIIMIGVWIAALTSVFPFLFQSSYIGSAGLHGMIEMVGALCGMVSGFIFIVHFWAFASRVFLFIGLAFFINGAEDFAHGFMGFGSFHNWIGLPASSLAKFIPGTYVTGRFVMAIMLSIASFLPLMSGKSRNSQTETLWVCPITVGVVFMLTVGVFYTPLPQFIFPDWAISRPVDFLSAFTFCIALFGFIRLYYRAHDFLVLWVAFSVAANIVGQFIMSFSKVLYDPCFDIAHVYKVFGYIIPMLGFSLYQILVVNERNQAIEKLRVLTDTLDRRVAERTTELEKSNEDLNIEIKERELAENQVNRQAKALKAINKVFRERIKSVTEEDLGKTCLRVAEKLTDSKFGLIGELNERGLFDTYAISNPGWDACNMAVTDARRYINSMPIRGVDRATMRDGKSRIVNGEEAVINHPDHVKTPEGHPKVTSFLGVPLKLEGKTIGMIGLGNKEGGYGIEDQENIEVLAVAIVEAMLSKRNELKIKQTEEQLSIQKDFLNNVFESITHPFYVIDANDYTIKMANKALGAGDLSQKVTCHELTHRCNKPCDDPESPCPLEEIKRTKKAVSVEHIYYDNDGNLRNMEVHGYPIFDDKGEVIQMIEYTIDNTKRKKIEEQLKVAQKMASLGKLTAGVFHEILNPINIISSHVQLLLMDAEKGSQTEEDLKSVQEEIKRVVKITDSLLRYSRSRKREIDQIDINSLLEKTISIVEPELKCDNINFIRKFDAKLPEIMASSDELRQVFLNLTTNARGAMPDGGTITIIIQCVEIDGNLFIRIRYSDTGCGINKKDIDRIFEPFYTTKEEGKGVGMGLSMLYNIIQNHHGTISVESEVGKGTTFTIDLPV